MISLRQVLGIAIAVVAAIFQQYYISQAAWGAAFAVGVSGGFLAGYVATGTIRGGLTGAFTAGVTFGVGVAFQGANVYAQMAAQAVTGGVLESLQGGNFGHGFFAAGLTAAFMPQAAHRDVGVRAVRGALIGGTISKLTGGKFANGAISGAIQGAMMGSRRNGASNGGEENGLPERLDNAQTRRIGEQATLEANAALEDVRDVVYRTRREAARAWKQRVRPIADKYDTEIASRFFNRKGGFEIGSATSDGFRYFVDPMNSIGSSPFLISAGYIHTHPGTALFSRNDMNTALDMYKSVNGNVHNGQFDQVVMVSLSNGDIRAWSASSWYSSGGKSMNEKYYEHY